MARWMISPVVDVDSFPEAQLVPVDMDDSSCGLIQGSGSGVDSTEWWWDMPSSL